MTAESDCELTVIGLDICPVLLDNVELEASVLSRLEFVQHNFLEGPLPFEDDVSLFLLSYSSLHDPDIEKTKDLSLIDGLEMLCMTSFPRVLITFILRSSLLECLNTSGVVSSKNLSVFFDQVVRSSFSNTMSLSTTYLPNPHPHLNSISFHIVMVVSLVKRL